LTGIVARLSQYKTVPPNGLIIYCGEIISRNDQTEFEYHCLTPSSPVKSFSYTCSSQFKTDDAENLSKQSDTYALIVLDLHEACWGTMSGTDIQVLGTYDSIVPSKHSQGGQSSKRFERLRDIAINEFFVKLGDRVTTSILPLIGDSLKGVIIGGCGMTKDEFMKGEYLHHEIRKKVVGTFDTGYTNEHGLYELVEASKEKLVGMKAVHEKDVVDEFLKWLAKDMNKVAYGVTNVFDRAQSGQVKRAIVTSDKHDLIDRILPISSEKNFEVEVISANSDSGNIVNKGFGGIVAILRYG
jgi:peptide chain release factor subunit 1